MQETDILIVGAGFAGAATAYHLSQISGDSILVVESGDGPGLHASGRNASMVIQGTQSQPVRRLLAASRLFYQEEAQSIGFNQTGSLLLESTPALEKLRDGSLFESEIRTSAEIRRQIPLLEGHAFQTGLWTPGDGVMDIQRLLEYYVRVARSRGVRFRFATEVGSIQPGRHFEISTSAGPIRARRLINAAGAWASRVGRAAGASSIRLRSFKRHLFVLRSEHPVDVDAPPVWDLEKDFYFRPRSDGILFCICDSERDDQLDPTLDPEIQYYVAEVLWKELPALKDAERTDAWACFRTFTGDGLPVIGEDPGVPGYYWVSGLAGFGMSASWEIGRLAALAVTGEQTPPEFDPGRFEEPAAEDGLSRLQA